MLTALIIDDEINGRFALQQKLRDYCPDVEVVGEAANGEEGLALIQKMNPQLVFLDIEMPILDGFEMLMKLPEKHFHLVFTTAYDHYAIKAIKYAAFDYLLKPIDIDELKITIERLTQQTLSPLFDKKLETLEQNLSTRPKLNKLAIPTAEGLLFFDLNHIVHLEAESNYTTIFFDDHPRLIASRTLKEFEDILPQDIFFRPHNSHIINLHFIKRYIRGDGGQIEMKDGKMVLVSRRKKEEFLKL
ncbi:MAG TPA: LytTR family DNA-binding domain-containing protein, partial [Saprospiraceae bacterium]|nr:LytTR family DNA-binding domain-containing protein [Saprospiraceae bacterium]